MASALVRRDEATCGSVLIGLIVSMCAADALASVVEDVRHGMDVRQHADAAYLLEVESEAARRQPPAVANAALVRERADIAAGLKRTTCAAAPGEWWDGKRTWFVPARCRARPPSLWSGTSPEVASTAWASTRTPHPAACSWRASRTLMLPLSVAACALTLTRFGCVDLGA